ncbi:MAG: non-homologous end-joining DNA ligase, partial [Pyrinomonadaceae bacterium]
IEARKAKRRGRLLIDTARNAYAQTADAPYAVRVIKGAPVSTPLDWDELSDSKLNAQRYNIRNIFQRLSRKANPWKAIPKSGHSLNKARRRLAALLEEEHLEE